MDLNDYQKRAHITSRFRSEGIYTTRHQLMSTLGLCGESGEVADLLKKVIYHGHPLDRTLVAKEIGDVLWYVAELCTAFDLSLGAIAELNLAKLQQRYGDAFSTQASMNRSE